jgi:hypothetical protein
MSGIAPKQNAFKLKIAPQKQKSMVTFVFDRKMNLLPGQRKSKKDRVFCVVL